MPQPAYPLELEAHWLQVAQAETRSTSLRDTLHRLLPDITRLADRLASRRDPGMRADDSVALFAGDDG